LSQQAGSQAERSRSRERARTWLAKSLDLYRGLLRSGALAGEDAAAPTRLESMLAELKAKPSS
jgi:hypothetical protein